MKTAAPLEDIVLPDSYEHDVRLGDLWSDGPAVLVWLRHWGWTFCRQHVAQLRDRYEEFEAKRAGVAAIGMGLVPMAAHFRDEHDIPFPLLIDRHRATHQALELKRGNLLDIVGPKQVARGVKAFFGGSSAGRPAPKQDVLQLGGALVVAPGGKVLYRHQATGSEDNAPVDDLLAALP